MDSPAWLAACVVLGGIPALAEVPLAVDGVAQVRIVLARESIPAERTAAEELARFLERATGGHFPIAIEGEATAVEPALFVRPQPTWGPEEWRIRTAGSNLVLEGGRPRGTLYAAYHFLEEVAGVRWWTPYDDSVPTTPTLVVAALDRRGQPAFPYRDVAGLDGPVEFSARNRPSGHRSGLGRAHGGRQAYGPPSENHGFHLYVPAAEYFASHPEFFSERDGRRTSDRAQLCLTNPDLRQLLADKLAAYVEQAQEAAAASGEEAPRTYSVSQSDWGGACTCEACAAIDRREGSHAGSLVLFLNSVSDLVAQRCPDILIDTLAYHYTFTPPKDAKLRPNVVVRLSALQRRDFSKPVSDRAHREYQRAIDGWRRVTAHLRIWDYSVTFGPEAELPLPNLPVIAADLRYYFEHGVEGLFIQHEAAILADMRDLKVWVLLKLLEDPQRDVRALVQEFTEGYYGASGGAIRDYLDLLERAVARRPSRIRYPAKAAQYRYLDAEFLREAQGLFDRAEELVAGDPLLLGRVRYARLSLDRATLLRWSPGLGKSARSRAALDPRAIADRYWETAGEEIERRIPNDVERDRQRTAVADEITRAMIALGWVPPE